MMLDELSQRTQYGLVAALAVAVAVGFGAGTVVSGGSNPVGAVTADNGGNAASSDAVKQKVQSFMDKQVQRQQQQLAMMASQSPNMSADDFSMDASVTDVSASQYGSLQKVTVSITGTVPARTGGTRSLDRDQTFYVSQDGRYLFQEPTDLEQPQQPAPTAGQAPSGQ